ncbi:hypothetical protein [Nocardiopsis sp. NRRL B-16309]|uniref:hypothetical protein n=1 Tax=Nocardiopsis sp. NRRL B-16309 TaxID=1519494 RepID=UPI0006B00000|nr:hypothetical protein [Nocardiopsis sp. NRRL B-16309]KOX09971.1 hypothetical protein ADL05_24815 [Nocardiopsis sp. NRRL B-16309]
MEPEVWSLALPVEGLPLKKLSVIGSGKDLEMRIVREGGPLLVLPLEGMRSTVSDDVVLEVGGVDDVSLELAYEAPELVLTRLRVHWDGQALPGVAEELDSLFGDAPKVRQGRCELTACVDVEFGLAAQNAVRAHPAPSTAGTDTGVGR